MSAADESTRRVRVGVLGAGNVGAALVSLIGESHETLLDTVGIDLVVGKVAVRDVTAARAVELGSVTDDALSVVTDPEIDVVVELIGGIEPARTLIIEALKAGKPVVTANKELLANAGSELYALASSTGCPLLFEAAVGGAIPLVRALNVSLAGEAVKRVVGIVNGTTNFILSKMSDDDLTYVEALAEARRLGYAESDPSADVKGHDAAAKAAILASLAFNAEVVADDVYREGIESVEVGDIDFARRLGYVVKLLVVAERIAKNSIAVRVHPAMLPMTHPLAGVRGPYNAVFIEGASAGELMLYGQGAGGRATASAVLGDLLDAARTLSQVNKPTLGRRERLDIVPIDELHSQYYVTIDVADRPGVLADVAAVFGAHRVSIRSMEQVGLAGEARLVFITHSAQEKDMQATLAGLREIEAVERIGGLLRVIGPEQ
jgi:homoserine dehydrogenase